MEFGVLSAVVRKKMRGLVSPKLSICQGRLYKRDTTYRFAEDNRKVKSWEVDIEEEIL